MVSQLGRAGKPSWNCSRSSSLARDCFPSVVSEVQIRGVVVRSDPRLQILTLPPASRVALSKLFSVSLPWDLLWELNVKGLRPCLEHNMFQSMLLIICKPSGIKRWTRKHGPCNWRNLWHCGESVGKCYDEVVFPRILENKEAGGHNQAEA